MGLKSDYSEEENIVNRRKCDLKNGKSYANAAGHAAVFLKMTLVNI
ncbi:MAG: hypothetical protein KAS66_12500 [Candidatus Omnitrophica bacterium]|nr:hypothetical protein [Candidatus Omnitrophota bacterium]